MGSAQPTDLILNQGPGRFGNGPAAEVKGGVPDKLAKEMITERSGRQHPVLAAARRTLAP